MPLPINEYTTTIPLERNRFRDGPRDPSHRVNLSLCREDDIQENGSWQRWQRFRPCRSTSVRPIPSPAPFSRATLPSISQPSWLTRDKPCIYTHTHTRVYIGSGYREQRETILRVNRRVSFVISRNGGRRVFNDRDPFDCARWPRLRNPGRERDAG